MPNSSSFSLNGHRLENAPTGSKHAVCHRRVLRLGVHAEKIADYNAVSYIPYLISESFTSLHKYRQKVNRSDIVSRGIIVQAIDFKPVEVS